MTVHGTVANGWTDDTSSARRGSRGRRVRSMRSGISNTLHVPIAAQGALIRTTHGSAAAELLSTDTM